MRFSIRALVMAVASLLLVGVSSGVSTSGAAGAAAAGSEDFVPPTDHKVVRIVCKKVDEETWRATFTWRVKGGRYLNLGNRGNVPKKRDVVRNGGRRFVKTASTIRPWGDGPVEAPESGIATYIHDVAPIHDKDAWIELTDRVEVELPCK